jgi:hypothetical protein
MKRSKIFLGITTGVLAVVAFTAAKSAKFSHTAQGYYSISGGARCTVLGNKIGFTAGSKNGSSLTLKTSGNTQTLYSYNHSGNCNPDRKLYTDAKTEG